jgi:muconolactone D-isomerase
MERSLFKMLFLLKVEIKKIPDIPIKDFFGFIIKEWEYFIRMKKRGKILAGGKLAGSRGAVAIIEVDTNEELDQLVTNLPLFPFFTDIEITPLVFTDKALTDVKRIHSLMK